MPIILRKARRAEPEGARKKFGNKWYIKTSTGWKPEQGERKQKEDEPTRKLNKLDPEEPAPRTPRGQRPTRQHILSAATPSESAAERIRRERSKFLMAIEFLQKNNISAEAAKAAFQKFKELSDIQQKRISLSEYLMKEAIKENTDE